MVDANTSQNPPENVIESSSFISLDTATKLIRDFDGSKRELVTEFVDKCKLAL